MTKLLIIEDTEEVRDIIKIILSQDKNIEIFEADTLSAAYTLIDEVFPHIILLDLNLPDGKGSDICKKIRSRSDIYGRPIILALTSDTSQDSVNLYLKLGCDDYIKKPFDFVELRTRLLNCIERLPKDEKILLYKNMKLELNKNKVIYNGENVDLSKNEFYLLEYFVINQGILLSRSKILNYLWEDPMEVSNKAVDQCLKRLRKKIPILNEILISKRGIGYILDSGGL